jgi:hypothetical protein
MMDTKVCQFCWAVVATRMAEAHEEWHMRISEVAIENTKRIDAVVQSLTSLLQGLAEDDGDGRR